jgi:hypothetical protein
MIRKAEPPRIDIELYETAAEFQRIMNAGVNNAKQESRRAGVPCVYSINGILHWELPDGSLTTTDPWKGPDRPEGAPTTP